MPKLRTYLSGLCLMTPAGPETQVRDRSVAGPLQVVMPASPSRKSNHVSNFTIPVHLPFAIIPLKNIAGSNKRHIDYKVEYNGEVRGIFLFSRERLSYEGFPTGNLTFKQDNPTPGEKPIGNGDETDVNWIADLRQIWPEAATIDSLCLTTNTSYPLPSTVAAQLVLGGGVVRTAFPAKETTIMRFTPIKQTEVRHVITRQCVVEQDLPDTVEFSLLTQSIETGADTTPVILKTQFGKDLDITIGNADFQDVLAIAVSDVTPIHFSVDPDFEVYYDILKVPDGTSRPIPVILGDHGSHDNCPVGRANGG